MNVIKERLVVSVSVFNRGGMFLLTHVSYYRHLSYLFKLPVSSQIVLAALFW
jgi:hypothetical protein